MGTVEEAKALVCDLCRNLYAGGHVSGTGGGISIRVGEAIVMAPSGVQKERMEAQDMFVLDARGGVVHTPEARPPPYKAPKLSECAPLFMSVRLRAVAAGGGGRREGGAAVGSHQRGALPVAAACSWQGTLRAPP